MSNLGGFSDEALYLYQLAASENGYDFSEEGDTYDFARCVRPDGSAYGTRGKCRKGTEEAKPVSGKEEGGRARPSAGRAATAKRVVSQLEKQKITDEKERLQKLVARGDREAMEKLRKMREEGKIGKEKGYGPGNKSRQETLETKRVKEGKSPVSDTRTRPRGAIESDIKALRQKTKGGGLEASKANTEIKKLEAELAKPLKGGNKDKMTSTPARKPRATSSELRDSQRKLYDEAKAKRAAAKEAEKEAKRVERETKGDKSKEARQRRMEAARAWDKAGTAADRAQRAWEREHERWSKTSNREKRAKMSPAQRAEARRVDKIIKERG